MSDVTDGTQWLIDRLAEHGVTATDDPASLNPPAVLIDWPTPDFDYLDGTLAASYPLWCVVPNTGARNALDAAWQLVEAVRAVPLLPVSCEPGSLADPQGGDALPAYRLTVNLTLDRKD